MPESLLIGLSLIIILGVLAQWIAWKFRIPSILLLLVFGFLSGPVFGFLKPDELFGPLLFPIVSISVAIILFEGGLSLRIKELRAVGAVLRNLISIGALVTWATATVAAYFILKLDFSLSLLLGAILVVTGPTVIIPLLRQIRPNGSVASLLKWEGILIDPIGAILAVLVFEAILVGTVQEATAVALFGFLKTFVLGSAFGSLGAFIIIFVLRRHLVPDFLQNPISLTIIVGFFTISNLLQNESGLFTVTLMGVILANQKFVNVRHIVEFKENLRVLLISSLFILLAARLQYQNFSRIGGSSFAFLAILVFVSRPLAVFLSTIGSQLNLKERWLLAWVAPRGIVAAAVSSIFALTLAKAGYRDAEILVSITFFVIVGTITIYGLTASLLAKALKLSSPDPQGVLILGAHRWARMIGAILHDHGIPVLFMDNNWRNIQLARMSGLPTFYGSALSEHILDEIDLTGIGRLLALTPNDEVNSLAAFYYSDEFGSDEVYQLAPEEEGEREDLAIELLARILFGANATFSYIRERIRNGAEIKLTNITEEFDFDHYHEFYGNDALPLFILTDEQKLIICTETDHPMPKPGDKLIGLAEPS